MVSQRQLIEDNERMQKRLSNIKEPSKFIIDPRKSKRMNHWQKLLVVALVYVAIVTPYEVGFLNSTTTCGMGFAQPLFWANRAVDLIFLVDLFLCFCTMYPENANAMRGEVWVASRSKIVRHYLRGWFTIDLVALAAGGLDVWFASAKCDEQQATDVSEDIGKIVRVLFRLAKAARLVKMLRLMKIASMLRRWEASFSIDYSRFSLIRCVVQVILVSHWFACFWGLETSFQPTVLQSWMGEFEYCTAVASASASSSSSNVPTIECAPPFTLYIAAFYFAVATLTSIGYGDLHAQLRNPSEQLINAILMLFGGTYWAYVIGELCAIIHARNPDARLFHQTIDNLNRFLELYGLPAEMRSRLRAYFHATKHLQIAEAHHKLLTVMSPALQAEVMWSVHRPWLTRVSFLKHAPRYFMAELSIALQAQVYAPGEVAPRGYLYVIQSGVVLYGGRVLAAGSTWGLDVIIADEKLRSRSSGRAMNYVETYRISGERLLQLASLFPDVHKHMRWHAVKLAMHRFIVLEARKSMAENFRQPSSPNGGGGGRGPSSGSMLIDMLKRTSENDEESMDAAAKAAYTRRRPPATGGGGVEQQVLPPIVSPASPAPPMNQDHGTTAALHSKLAEHGRALSRLEASQQQLTSEVSEIRQLLKTAVDAITQAPA